MLRMNRHFLRGPRILHIGALKCVVGVVMIETVFAQSDYQADFGAGIGVLRRNSSGAMGLISVETCGYRGLTLLPSLRPSWC